jgi:hypothetical protein
LSLGFCFRKQRAEVFIEAREVVVPLRIYKTVTVFSTLLAVVLVVLGFAFLDAATIRGGMFGILIDAIPVSLSLPISSAMLDAALATIGLACIAAGAGVYVLGARFRTAGMGKGKDAADGPENDG